MSPCTRVVLALHGGVFACRRALAFSSRCMAVCGLGWRQRADRPRVGLQSHVFRVCSRGVFVVLLSAMDRQLPQAARVSGLRSHVFRVCSRGVFVVLRSAVDRLVRPS